MRQPKMFSFHLVDALSRRNAAPAILTRPCQGLIFKAFGTLLLGLAAAVVPGSSRAMATYREVRFSSFSTDAQVCNQGATSTAHAMMTQHRVNVVRAFCSPDSQSSLNQSIVVGYESDTEIRLASADDDQYDGGYDSQSECVTDLPRQKLMFAQVTGLPPLIAYCTPEHNLRIHAVGTSLTRYLGFSINLGSILEWPSHDPLITDPALIQQQVAASLAAQGLNLARVVLKTGDFRTAGLYVFYYAARPDYRFGVANVVTLPSMALCEGQIPDFGRTIALTGIVPLVHFCARERGGTSELATLYTFGMQTPPHSSGPLSEHRLDVPFKKVTTQAFTTLNDCQIERADVEHDEQAFVTRRIVGSVCTLPFEDRPTISGQPWYYRVLVFFNSN